MLSSEYFYENLGWVVYKSNELDFLRKDYRQLCCGNVDQQSKITALISHDGDLGTLLTRCPEEAWRPANRILFSHWWCRRYCSSDIKVVASSICIDLLRPLPAAAESMSHLDLRLSSVEVDVSGNFIALWSWKRILKRVRVVWLRRRKKACGPYIENNFILKKMY